MTWHVDQETIGRYVSNEVDRVAAASIEAHLTECGECRADLSIDAERFARTWAGVRATVEAPGVGWFERGLKAVRIRPDVARLLAVTPGLRMSCLLALAVAVGFGLMAAASAGSEIVARWFLVVAPIMPVAGVLIGFSSLADPAHELGLSVPVDRFWLTMLRSSLVAGSAMGILLTVDVTVGVVGSSGAWLLPAVASTCLSLALTPRVGALAAAVVVSAAWLFAVLPIDRGEVLASSGFARLVIAALAIVSLVVVVSNRDRFRRGEVWL